MLDFRGVTENCLALVIFSAAGLILDLLQRGRIWRDQDRQHIHTQRKPQRQGEQMRGDEQQGFHGNGLSGVGPMYRAQPSPSTLHSSPLSVQNARARKPSTSA